jgi:glycosyltransferase involved in cell wall biosynthesis
VVADRAGVRGARVGKGLPTYDYAGRRAGILSRRAAMKSLHIIGGKSSGGAERFYVRLVNALARRGEDVTACVVDGGAIDRMLDPGIARVHAPMAGVWDLWSRWKIARAARGRDIAQSYMGRATRLTHLKPGGPVHIARLGGFYDLKGYRHAHAWVGNTRGICDYLVREGLPSSRVFHIGNFVDAPEPVAPGTLAALRAELGIAPDARIVLGLGRLHPNKGFADLLEAFARLPREIDARPVHLLLVGDGPLAEALRARALRLDLGARISFAGWRDPSPCYRLAELFVCPSVHEPLGNVVLEAWAHALPVISTATDGPREFMRDGADGWLVPVSDPARLAERIEAMLSLPDNERAILGAAGAARIAKEFSEDAIVAAYLALYEALTLRTT